MILDQKERFGRSSTDTYSSFIACMPAFEVVSVAAFEVVSVDIVGAGHQVTGRIAALLDWMQIHHK